MLAEMERNVGGQLTATPMSLRDQWTATMRDDFAALGADITDPVIAQAAFAGGYLIAQALLPTSVVPIPTARMAILVLRALADRADQPPPAPIEDWWQA